MAFAVNIFCEFVSSVGQLSNGPSNFLNNFLRNFLQDFLKNIIEFVLSEQFEGNLNDICATLRSKIALMGISFWLQFRPI